MRVILSSNRVGVLEHSSIKASQAFCSISFVLRKKGFCILRSSFPSNYIVQFILINLARLLVSSICAKMLFKELQFRLILHVFRSAVASSFLFKSKFPIKCVTTLVRRNLSPVLPCRNGICKLCHTRMLI